MEFHGRFWGQTIRIFPVDCSKLKAEFCETIKVYFSNRVERKTDQLILLIIGKQ